MLRSHVNSLGSPRNEKATAGRICGKKQFLAWSKRLSRLWDMKVCLS